MAQKSGFFNSVNNDRVYDAADVARFLKKFFTNGVFNNTLQVTANDNMTISVAIGQANIEGYSYENTESLVLNIDDSDSTLSRIDSVIVRLDLSNRQITTQILEGSSATEPSQPSIIRSGNIYDLRLANISVPAGATRITSDMITDTRFTSDCGNVTQAILSLDTSDIFAQYQTAWDTWFSNIQTQLDGDVAGNLQNQINTKQDKVAGKGLSTNDYTNEEKQKVDKAYSMRNIMTAKLDSTTDVTSQTGTLTLTSNTNLGNKLTFSNGEIVVGTGVIKVKVSANMRLYNTVATAIGVNLNINKNGSTLIASNRTSLGASSYDGLATAPFLVEVEEDDIFSLGYWKSSTTQKIQMIGGAGATYLTVEVVEAE